MIDRRPNAFDAPSPEIRSEATRILRDVQDRVRSNHNVPNSVNIDFVQIYEHEYTAELISWLIDIDGPIGSDRTNVRSILDVGSGWGTTMHTGLMFGMDILGIDVSMIPCPDYRIEECDMFDLDRLRRIDFGRRDLIVLTEVLEHLSFDPIAPLEHMIRSTGASWIFISAPHGRYAEFFPLGRIHYRDLPEWRPGVADEMGPYVHRKPWEMDEIGDLLGELGFEIVGHRTTEQRNIVLGHRIENEMRPISGYARTSKCSDLVGRYHIPEDWWSRRYEYPWASQFCDANATVLDVGCGFDHPFKLHLADSCRMAYGMDLDHRIEGIDHPSLTMIHHDATTPWIMFEDGSIDRVFIISTIEHVVPIYKVLNILSESNRVLRLDGLLLVTFDVPDVSVQWFEESAIRCGFEYHGAVDRDLPTDVLVQRPTPSHPRPGPLGPEHHRKVFAAAMRRSR